MQISGRRSAFMQYRKYLVRKIVWHACMEIGNSIYDEHV